MGFNEFQCEVEEMIETNSRIAMGFAEAATLVGLSKSFLRNAAIDPDPQRRLKTVRVHRRRLIRERDLEDWFSRVSREEAQAA
jgi:hypothetical protein